VLQLCLTRTDQRGKNASLNLLATLCQMQPRIPSAFSAARAHCWLMLNLVSTRIFFAKLLSSLVSPQHTLVNGVVPPHVQDFALHLLELREGPV